MASNVKFDYFMQKATVFMELWFGACSSCYLHSVALKCSPNRIWYCSTHRSAKNAWYMGLTWAHYSWITILDLIYDKNSALKWCNDCCVKTVVFPPQGLCSMCQCSNLVRVLLFLAALLKFISHKESSGRSIHITNRHPNHQRLALLKTKENTPLFLQVIPIAIPVTYTPFIFNAE